jgi:hypothetical protein
MSRGTPGTAWNTANPCSSTLVPFVPLFINKYIYIVVVVEVGISIYIGVLFYKHWNTGTERLKPLSRKGFKGSI